MQGDAATFESFWPAALTRFALAASNFIARGKLMAAVLAKQRPPPGHQSDVSGHSDAT
jgi:hypothetical protein